MRMHSVQTASQMVFVYYVAMLQALRLGNLTQDEELKPVSASIMHLSTFRVHNMKLLTSSTEK